MNTPRKKITSLWTIARPGNEPGSSGPQASMLTTMPCHFHFQKRTFEYRTSPVFYIPSHQNCLCLSGLYNVVDSTPANSNTHDKDKTNVDFDNDDFNYAIVIDAGSSGSRAYLYFWPEHSGNPKSLLKIDPICDKTGEPLVKAVTPGLSR